MPLEFVTCINRLAVNVVVDPPAAGTDRALEYTLDLWSAVLAHCHIEDHSVRVKLWRCIVIYRTRCVVLERRCNKLACVFRRMDIADTRLRVSL
jgi:hypothetical protein